MTEPALHPLGLMEPESQKQDPMAIRAHNTSRAAMILLAIAVLVELLSVYWGVQMGVWPWPLLALIGAVLVFGLACIAVLVLVRQARLDLAAWLLMGSTLAMGLAISALVAGTGLLIGPALVLGMVVISSRTVPVKQTSLAVVAGIVAGLVALLPDQFGLAYRLSTPRLQPYIPLISAAVAVVLGYLIARRFGSYTLRGKMLVVVLAMAALAIVSASLVARQTMKSTLEKQIGETYVKETESLAGTVDRFFEAKTAQLAALAVTDLVKEELAERNASYTGDSSAILAEIQALDARWTAAGDDDPLIRGIIAPDPEVNPTALQLKTFLEAFPDQSEIFVTDRHGATLAATGRLSDYYQADEEWWQMAWDDGRGAVYISDPEYDESAGIVAVLVAMPVRDEETGEVTGIVRSTLAVDELYSSLGAVKFGETGHAVLLSRDAQVLFEPEGYESSADLPLELRQQLVSTGPYQVMTDAQGEQSLLAHLAVADMLGAGRYETEAAVREAIKNLGWAIVVRQKVAEAMAPVAQLTQNILVAVFLVVFLAGLLSLAITQALARPIVALTEVTESMSRGDLDAPLPPAGGDEVGRLTTSFGHMARQLKQTLTGLEQQVAARTHNLEAAARVSSVVSSVLDLDELERRVVELVRESFDLYYVGLFRIDQTGEWTGEAGRWAVLRAGSGQAGQAMREQGYKLEAGGASMIGRCVATGMADVQLDVGEAAVRFSNPLLPLTRSEMALPLVSRGQVLGAMTIQSKEVQAFGPADIATMQTMADQVAGAIENALSFARAEAALKQAEELHQRYLGRAGAEYVQARTVSGYRQVGAELMPLPKEALSEVQRAVAERRTLIAEAGQNEQPDVKQGLPTLTVPLIQGDRVVGALGFRAKEQQRGWSQAQVAMVESLAEQLVLAADNQRLLDETQRRAAQERLVGEVTARIRQTLDVGTVLDTAVDEIARALGLEALELQVGTVLDQEPSAGAASPAPSDQGERDARTGGTAPVSRKRQGPARLPESIASGTRKRQDGDSE